ncbi:hypothetical protein DCAR_0728644 [Daucus carota subsp. sativus]|uniref:Uncharacterized protein n=1 Tax=Daucus carota subsp. sativus TaxID=79200 RepID=A0A164TR27_DAUCS|nr:hypothetical protein DCAR_0728644 [Daucus carota subsp. sativus]
MASAPVPSILQAPCINNCTNFIKLSPEPTETSRVIYRLGSFSETELKELKDKFISDLERVRSLLKQVESRELELVHAEDVDLREQGNSVDKASKIIGGKRTLPVSSDGEIKRKRLVKKTVDELN